jgi:putative transposase
MSIRTPLALQFIQPPQTILYKSDLTMDQWMLIEPEFPGLPFSLRPRIHRLWIVNAILYVKRTGCQWEMLPHCYPHYKTVHYYFSMWSKMDLWSKIVKKLHVDERLETERDAEPSAIVLDSRTTKTVARKKAMSQLALMVTKS